LGGFFNIEFGKQPPMKVILKEYIYKHGVAGDVIDVADGFARNYLIPRGLAVKATKRAMDESTSLMAEAAMRRNELNDRLIAVAKQIDGVELVFGRKAGSNGKLYGSVTTTEVAQALLDKTGLDINRRRISDRALRELGKFEVPVRMGNDLSPILHVVIVREEDLANYLAASAAAANAPQDSAAPDVEAAMVETESAEE
jgi:large subunit ribosomal protein L9